MTPSILSRCPFCGGEAEFRTARVSDDCEAAWVRCRECFAETASVEDAYADHLAAASLWNHRTAASTLPVHLGTDQGRTKNVEWPGETQKPRP